MAFKMLTAVIDVYIGRFICLAYTIFLFFDMEILDTHHQEGID
jgi:hypothetical protein